MLSKAGLEGINGSGTAHSNGAVVNMYSNDNEDMRGLGMFVEDCLIDLALHESKAGEDLSEFLVPALPSLLESIQGLAQLKDMPRGILRVARRIAHVQYFVGCELAVQVCTLDVDLVKFKAKLIGHSDDSARGGKSCNGGIGIEVIYPLNLAEALCNEPSFVAHNFAQGILLGLENPLGANDICSWWCMLESPGAGCANGVELFTNGLLPERPFRSSFCFGKIVWFECLRLSSFSH